MKLDMINDKSYNRHNAKHIMRNKRYLNLLWSITAHSARTGAIYPLNRRRNRRARQLQPAVDTFDSALAGMQRQNIVLSDHAKAADGHIMLECVSKIP